MQAAGQMSSSDVGGNSTSTRGYLYREDCKGPTNSYDRHEDGPGVVLTRRLLKYLQPYSEHYPAWGYCHQQW
jgi:hypothetical protein